jgi:type IV pilus assembly protein PilE
MLTDVAQSLEKCKTLYGAYNNANCNAFTAVSGGNTRTSENGFYVVSVVAASTGATQFQVQAAPQQAQVADLECATFTLNQAGVRGISGTGTAADCW